MRMFSKFFGSRSKNGQATGSAILEGPEPTVSTPINESLFVDREAPETGEGAAGSYSFLAKLASQDLTEQGYADGYRFHDPEMCAANLERIRANVRHALEAEIDQCVDWLGELHVQVSRFPDDEDSSTVRALRAKQQHLDFEMMRLREALLLTNGNTGHVEIPVSSYSSGFGQGMAAFIDAELLTRNYTRR